MASVKLTRPSRQISLFLGAGIAILAGASFNIQGYQGETAVLAMLAGIAAWAAGVTWRRWSIAVSLLLFAIALTAVEVKFSRQFLFGVNAVGVLCLVLGGVLSALAYNDVTVELRRRMHQLERANRDLEEKHVMFLAATEDASGSMSDPAALSAVTARQSGAKIALFYVASAAGQEFQPMLPATGLDGRGANVLRPRREGGDPLTTLLNSNQEFHAEDRDRLQIVARLFPPGFRLQNVLVTPMLMGDRLGGFLVLANRETGFDEDDRRLARTLASRTAVYLGSRDAVAQTEDEKARYTLLNDIARNSAGLPLDQVIELVVTRANQIVPNDSCRVVLFEGDGTYEVIGQPGPRPRLGNGPLAEVAHERRAVVRRLQTRPDGLLSGIDPGSDTAQVAEALVPITGSEGVIGALCLGRRGGMAFGDRDIPALEELGAIAGVAIENSRRVQLASARAVKVTGALDVLSLIPDTLAVATSGSADLERALLDMVCRQFGATHALLTAPGVEGRQAIVGEVGFGRAFMDREFANGQGIVGAVMLSRRPVSTPDVGSSFDLASPPDLAAAGIRAALCVPIIRQQELEGTLSIFLAERREWTEEDERILSSLGSVGIVALGNAELYESSRRTNAQLEGIVRGLEAISTSIKLEDLLQTVVTTAATEVGAQIGVLALAGPEGLAVRAAHGTDSATGARLALDIGSEICGEVMESGQPFMAYSETPVGTGPLDPRAVLCVPLTLLGRSTGVFFLANYAVGSPFSDDNRVMAQRLGAEAAVALENARLFDEVEQLFLETITLVADAVDAKDPYTAGHSRRVTEYMLLIAREYGYAPGDEPAWQRLRQGGLLHDIGKIAVPDHILGKPGRLTDEEFAVIKLHPSRGFELLKRIHKFTDELVIVRSHHERYDGRGYPDGRAGNDLPIIAWIAAVADAFDAMTSDRPYRKGMSIDLALAEIAKGSGTQFHPDVAAAALRAARNGTFAVIAQASMYENAPTIGAFVNPN